MLSELRNCQTAALECIQRRFQDEQGETNIEMCTGSGKSLVEAMVLKGFDEEDEANRQVIVFPNLMLLKQNYENYSHFFNHVRVFYCCTEGTLGGIDRITSQCIDLLLGDSYIILTTYRSAPQILFPSFKKRQLAIDLLIHDEAHHMLEPVYMEELKKTTVRRSLNFSATLPEGKTPHYKYSLLRGIKDEVVRDFFIHLFLSVETERDETTLLVNMILKLREFHDKVKLLVYTEEADTNEESSSSVKTFMIKFAPVLRSHGFQIEGINSDTKNRSEVLCAFENSETDVSILVSCRTLNEGVDLKNANAMLPWDPVKSLKDNIQRIGRILRLMKDADGNFLEKQDPATVMVPVFLEREKYAACNGDRVAVDRLISQEIDLGERGNFRPIVNVCVALKEELAEDDPELFHRLLHYPKCSNVPITDDFISSVCKKIKKRSEAVLGEIAEKLFNEGNIDEEEKQEIETGIWTEEYNDRVLDALVRCNDLTLIVKDSVDSTDEVFGNGSKVFNVQKCKDDTYKVSAVRRNASSSTSAVTQEASRRVAKKMQVSFSEDLKIVLGIDTTLSEAQRLEDFVMTRLTTEVVQKNDLHWEENRQKWLEQRTRLGKKPSECSKDPEERRAGLWKSDQRKAYWKGTLSADRIKALESTEGWTWEEWIPSLHHWSLQLARLGRKPSCHSKDPEERRAAIWQSTQRKAYNQGTLCADRIKTLESTEDWTWEEWIPSLQHWSLQYAQLGRKPFSHSKDPEEKRAAKWQSNQREAYWKGTLSADRIKTLESTEGWSWGSSRSNRNQSVQSDSSMEIVDDKDKETVSETSSLSLDELEELELEESEKDEEISEMLSVSSRKRSHSSVSFEKPKASSSSEESLHKRRSFVTDSAPSSRKEYPAGYQSTNVDMKYEINQILASELELSRHIAGKVILLDHVEFHSSISFCENGAVHPEDLIIPQYDEVVYEEMGKHEKFGSSTVRTTLNSCLDNFNSSVKLKCVYADLTCCVDTAAKTIEKIAEMKNLASTFLLAVTVSLRNPHGSEYIGEAGNRLLDCILQNFWGKFAKCTNVVGDRGGSKVCFHYGDKQTMETWIFRFENF